MPPPFRIPAKSVLVALVFLAGGLSAWAAAGDLPTTPSEVRTGGSILGGLPTRNGLFPQLGTSPAMQYLAWTCMLFGGVFLLWGHAARTENKRGDEMVREQMRTWVTLAAMLMSSFLLGNLANIADKALAETTKSPIQVARQVALAIDMMPDPAALITRLEGGHNPEPVVADPAASEDGGGFLSSAWRKLTNITDSASGMVKGLLVGAWEFSKEVLKAVITLLIMCVVQCMMLIAQIALWLLEQIRFVVLVVGGAFLPLFISAWGLNRDHWFYESGRKFTISMMGVALWPFAWMIFGLLTASFFAAWIKAIALVGIWEESKMTVALLDDATASMRSLEIIDGVAKAEQVFEHLTMTALGPLLAMTIGTAFLVLWLVIAPFKLAFWFQDMLLTGANKVLDGTVSGAKAAGKMAAMGTGAVMAGSGAVMASGGSSAVTKKALGEAGAMSLGRTASAMGEAMGRAASGSATPEGIAASIYKVVRAAQSGGKN
jgi:hypothetical protein